MTEPTNEDSTSSTSMVPGASLQEHAMQEITSIEAGLADLETKYRGVVYDVTTTEGMEAAREARAAIRDPRYKLEKVRAATSKELTTIQRAVNAEAARIKGRIEEIEHPIHQQINAEEERIEAERAAKREAAAARTAALRAQVDAIKGTPLTLIGAGEQEIREAIDALNARDLQAEFDDVWLPDAVAARNAALPAMDTLLAERIAMAERQAQMDREAEERRAAEAAEAERRRQAEEVTAQMADKAKAHAEQEAEQRRQQQAQEDAERAARLAEDQRQAGITTAIDGIRRQAFAKATSSAEIRTLMETLGEGGPLTSDTYGERVQEAEAARAESLDTLGSRLKTALDQEERAEHLRQQAEAAERERLEREEADRQAQAQREQEAAQARAQAEADAVASATLRSAAEDALALLQHLSNNNPPATASSLAFAFGEIELVTRKLAAALDRETQA